MWGAERRGERVSLVDWSSQSDSLPCCLLYAAFDSTGVGLPCSDLQGTHAFLQESPREADVFVMGNVHR